MRRSLLLSVYLYGLTVAVVVGGLAFQGQRLLLAHGHRELMRQFGQDQALMVGEVLEAGMPGPGPDKDHLEALARVAHATLTYVPWDDRPLLKPLAVDKVAQLAPREFLVRLDRLGKPIGAVDVTFGRAARPPFRLPLWWSGLFSIVLALIIVPPLWFWVLRPLRRMVEVANRLGAGDLDTPVAVNRKDELGNLEQAFEGLRVRIQQQLAARERLLTDISHELRGPLSRMALALPLARRRPDPAPYLDELEREMHAMAAMIAELLTFAREDAMEPANRVEVDLKELAEEAFAERGLALEAKQLSVYCRLAPAVTTGNRRLLARAMGNLVDNAIKYTPAGGALELATTIEDHAALFVVADNGPGIPAAELPYVFEPFYRPDLSRSRDSGGVGLGLAIVRRIAQAHAGHVELSAAPGGGTRAELRLPGRGHPVHRDLDLVLDRLE
ncbi:MAG: integral rane sensor signal transduction histidine kinase [Cyanobacteria bacterium RYN_339]|nr:integral rane sensor signal transduction histidine kinase [Cyanobacteria bacterium RYN_339]